MPTKVLACLVAGSALAIAVPSSAQAATGQFSYYTNNHWEVLPSNPANHTCHSFIDEASVVLNDTDTPAVVYADFHCQVPIGEAAVGTHLQVMKSGSVTFVGL